MSDLRWYVVQALPRKERLVRDRIAELGREAFLPLIPSRAPGRTRATLAPLFPSYLFARLAADAGDLPRVRWSHGVRSVLGEGESPRPVQDALIECIRARTDRSGRLKLGAKLKRGARVRIVDGPLTGLVGVLEKPVHSPDRRVSVLLELFHRLTRVELPAESVWGEAGTD